VKRLVKFLNTVIWTSALAVALVIAAVVTVVLGDQTLGLVLSISSVTLALLANKE